LTGRLLWLLAAVALAPAANAGPAPGGVFIGCDHNGDGKGDVARNNGATGIRTDILDNITSTANGNFANGGGVFVMKACGKFNGDAFFDIVAQGGGSIRVTYVGSTGTAPSATPPLFFGDGGGTWVVVDAQDVNGDGIDEIIAVNTPAAAVRITDVSTGAPVHSYLSTGGGIWQYMFAGDFNGDHHKDLLFNGTGAAAGVARVNLSGTTSTVFFPQGGSPPAWLPTGAGYFDLSGRTGEIDTGAGPALGLYRIRLTDATGNIAGAPGFFANGSGTYAIRTIADMDGDGIQDLGEYSSGANNRVTMLNGTAVKSQYITGNAGGSFQLRYSPDTNANQKSSLVSIDGSSNVRVQSQDGTVVTGTNVLAPAGGLVVPVY
jgi:hypothetical protein